MVKGLDAVSTGDSCPKVMRRSSARSPGSDNIARGETGGGRGARGVGDGVGGRSGMAPEGKTGNGFTVGLGLCLRGGGGGGGGGGGAIGIGVGDGDGKGVATTTGDGSGGVPGALTIESISPTVTATLGEGRSRFSLRCLGLVLKKDLRNAAKRTPSAWRVS